MTSGGGARIIERVVDCSEVYRIDGETEEGQPMKGANLTKGAILTAIILAGAVFFVLEVLEGGAT